MDKAVSHSLLASANIEQAHYLWFYADRYAANREKILNKILARLNFPVFVKPANAGSSVGITGFEPEKLDEAIRLAAQHDVKSSWRRASPVRRSSAPVLGSRGKSEASIIGEIGAAAEFYDYDDKYRTASRSSYIPRASTPKWPRRSAKPRCAPITCSGATASPASISS